MSSYISVLDSVSLWSVDPSKRLVSSSRCVSGKQHLLAPRLPPSQFVPLPPQPPPITVVQQPSFLYRSSYDILSDTFAPTFGPGNIYEQPNQTFDDDPMLTSPPFGNGKILQPTLIRYLIRSLPLFLQSPLLRMPSIRPQVASWGPTRLLPLQSRIGLRLSSTLYWTL